MTNLIVIRCLAGVVGLFGLFLAGFGVLILWQGVRMSVWPGVGGVMTAARLEERREEVSRSDGPTRTVVSFEPLVEYHYTVDGKDYIGRRISPADKQYARPLAQKVLDRYPVGAQVQVHYDPRNPDEAFLEINMGWGGIGLLLAGGALIAAAIWMATHAG
ncbi:MAG: DUF3592 domain-containing protein [Anaerolineae bacterium]|nr:DUF3592 domain-containing protein [Anaerolineae bacterium]